MSSKTASLLSLLIAFAAVPFAGCATGSSQNRSGDRVEGIVTRISPDAITLQSSEDAPSSPERRFSVADVPTDVNVGDTVVIWISPDASRVELKRRAGRPEPQAGQVAPGTIEQSAPGVIQRDDRIFHST
jgi:hypothetical protein